MFWYNQSYTIEVKTAVSVPDELFQQAEATARRLRMSRSQFYAKAIAELLKKEDGQAITERLNEVYSQQPSALDEALQQAQLEALKKNDWDE
jgi:metal-responsive CopG/Arc/MetJ family transcriptional regulator